MFIAVRVRGGVKVNQKIKDTLRMLRLNRKMHAVILKDNAINKGMLTKVRSWITWGEIDDSILELLVKKRGRKTGDERLNEEEVLVALKQIKEGKLEKPVKPVFRLTPPSKGFKKSIKQHYPNGELGYRGKEINSLVKRMI